MRKWIALLLCVVCMMSAAQAAPVKEIGPEEQHDFDTQTPLMRVYFLNMTARDGILIVCGDETMLVDCGGNNYGKAYVQPKLKKLGIDHIDYAVNTHPDDDHVSGFLSLMELVPIGGFYTGFDANYNRYQREVTDAAKKYKVPIYTIDAKTELSFGGIHIETYQNMNASTINGCSMIMHLTFGDSRMLLLADTPWDIQDEAAAAMGEGFRADIVKISHHGINTPTKEAFDAMAPQYAVITNGRTDNNQRTREFLQTENCPALFTPDGCVECITDGTHWTIRQIPYDKF